MALWCSEQSLKSWGLPHFDTKLLLKQQNLGDLKLLSLPGLWDCLTQEVEKRGPDEQAVQ